MLAGSEETTMQPDWPPKILAVMLALIAVAALTLASTYGWVQLPQVHASASLQMEIVL
ncbi:hypothetical protein [Sphingomonas hylomeconis]|uniref:Uncharacterized protein n=1 Tax=Sphingomonas hylomeconis TaxID=1395958 RepID=A0ABV7SSK2_9SPHN|nr:hypothetical protein [Sphingomonas hylomeconis]